MLEIKAPQFPESIADGEVAVWHVAVGEVVRRDQVLVDIETDKVVLEVVAPADGTLTVIRKAEGDTVLAEEVLGEFDAGEVAVATKSDTGPAEAGLVVQTSTDEAQSKDRIASPAAKKMADENEIDVTGIEGTGKGGRVTKEDILKAVAELEGQTGKTAAAVISGQDSAPDNERLERRVPMTRLRASIARRLVEAQQTAAMLTTFNEIDMTNVINVRNKYKMEFQREFGVKLGFMSFFVAATARALREQKTVNAVIEGDEIVYKNYVDISVAVSSPKGLVVPVLRSADKMSFSQIESQISTLAKKAAEGTLSIDEMIGGTFTISNGGSFGSLSGTPIINPPQSAILGMHSIVHRPVCIGSENIISARPMMNIALTYDHRLIDGREAVSFLKCIKESVEDPVEMLIKLY